MTEFNYGDIIEYTDGTLDLHFNAARKWAITHNATFDELMDKRALPKRYFQINEIIIPEPLPPTEEEMKEQVRNIRNNFLVDYVDNRAKSPFQWEEVPEEEKIIIGKYRRYLLDYTDTENWWLQNPLTYDVWKKEA